MIINCYNKILEGVIQNSIPVICLCITIDKKYIISGSSDKKIRIYRFVDRVLEEILEGHTHQIRCLQVTNDSRYLISASDKNIRL